MSACRKSIWKDCSPLSPGSMDYFKTAMNMTSTPRPMPTFEPRSPKWTSSLNHVTKRLEKLFRKHGKNQDEIHKTLHEVYFFIRQDLLYMPYLYNEILDMAGLARAQYSYAPKDLPRYKRIIKKDSGKSPPHGPGNMC